MSYYFFDKVLGQMVTEISKILSFLSHRCVRYIRNLSIYRTQWWDKKLKIVDISFTVCPRTLCKKGKLPMNESFNGWQFGMHSNIASYQLLINEFLSGEILLWIILLQKKNPSCNYNRLKIDGLSFWTINFILL